MRTLVLCMSVALLIISTSAPVWSIAAPLREQRAFDYDWRFQLGDPATAESPEFDDSEWRVLNVPHDWSIEGKYEQSNPAGAAGAFLPCGVGWYRKHFDWEPAFEGRRCVLQFDGVYRNAEVWINGRALGCRPYGYASFTHDLTDHLRRGDNVIAVRVDNSEVPSGRWYTGSGIYRHVWLSVTDPIHVPTWGAWIRTTAASGESVQAVVTCEVKNASPADANVVVDFTIYGPQGVKVACGTDSGLARSGGVSEFSTKVEIQKPLRWSPDHPEIHHVDCTVLVDGEAVDSHRIRFGVRDIEYSVDRGMILNGDPIELRGVCMHHDGGAVGAAVPRDVLRRRLLLLKTMGANAVRTSHNPFAPEFYDLCDELGLMVMNEAFDGWSRPKAAHDYGRDFAEWWHQDLKDFIRRDRNHPSVVMWSIGNEVRGWKASEQKLLVDTVRRLDPTRPVTQGEGARGPHLDIAGFNGHGEYRGAIEAFHTSNPRTPIVGTEITHTMQTRGVYRTKTWYRTRDNPAPWERHGEGAAARWLKIKSRVNRVPDLTEREVFSDIPAAYQSSYDNAFVRMNAREEIRTARRLPYLLGTFRWTAFDYLGESFGWPARTANFGIIDLAGFPKDAYHLYRSQWTDKPMVHVLPHWTHPGKEGVKIPVVAYSNQPVVDLRLNGVSLGERRISEELQAVWLVPYAPGKIEAIAKRGGREMSTTTVSTAGEAAVIKLTVDRVSMAANRQDVAHVEVTIVDDAGEPVPDAGHLVSFDVSGPARLIGVENGDILDRSPNKSTTRRAFMGKFLAMVQSLDEAGTVCIVASAAGVRSAKASLRVDAAPVSQDRGPLQAMGDRLNTTTGPR